MLIDITQGARIGVVAESLKVEQVELVETAGGEAKVGKTSWFTCGAHKMEARSKVRGRSLSCLISTPNYRPATRSFTYVDLWPF